MLEASAPPAAPEAAEGMNVEQPTEAAAGRAVEDMDVEQLPEGAEDTPPPSARGLADCAPCNHFFIDRVWNEMKGITQAKSSGKVIQGDLFAVLYYLRSSPAPAAPFHYGNVHDALWANPAVVAYVNEAKILSSSHYINAQHTNRSDWLGRNMRSSFVEWGVLEARGKGPGPKGTPVQLFVATAAILE